MMTKIDYEMVADVIYDRLQADTNDTTTLVHVTRELARAFYKDNPRFDTGKFVDRCGLGDIAMPYYTKEEIHNLQSR
jgi:hypothetical protein